MGRGNAHEYEKTKIKKCKILEPELMVPVYHIIRSSIRSDLIKQKFCQSDLFGRVGYCKANNGQGMACGTVHKNKAEFSNRERLNKRGK